MPRSFPIITNFTAGEVSPLIGGRIDLDRYRNACNTLRNVNVLLQGGARRRGGAHFVREVKISAKNTILIPFIFSDEQAYMLEFGDLYFRVYKDNGIVVDDDGTQEITNGNFPSNIASWDDDSTGTGSIAWNAGGWMDLIGVDSSNAAKTSQALTLTVGKQYRIRVDVANAPIKIRVDGATPGDGAYVSEQIIGIGSHSFDFTVAGSTTVDVTFNKDTGATAQIDNVSVREIIPVEVVTPYTENDLADLQFVQSYDIMWIVHRDHPPKELSRTSHVDWSLLDSPLANNPNNLVSGTVDLITNGKFDTGLTGWTDSSVTPGQVLHNTEFRAAEFYPRGASAAAIFDQQMTTVTNEKYVLRLKHLGSVNANMLVSLGTTQGAEDVLPQVTINGIANGKFTPVIYEFTAPGTTVWLRLKSTNDGWPMYIDDVSVQLLDPSSPNVNTYPGSVSFYQGRLCFGGTRDLPDGIFGSQSGDLRNFDHAEANDGDAFTYVIVATGGALSLPNIRFMSSLRDVLFVGTSSTEFTVSGGNDVVTPSNIKVSDETAWGAARRMPVRANKSLIFIQDGGRFVREVLLDPDALNVSFKANDLTILADHLTAGGVQQLAFQKRPTPIVWGVTGDGILISCTYSRDDNVVAWTRHDTDGLFKSVGVIPDVNGEFDDVWVVVERVINGSTVKYIEYFDRTMFVDSGLSYSGSPTATLTGLDHLEGETVQVVGDGAVFPDAQVSGGQITLSQAVSEAYVGLGYTSEVETVRVAGGNPAGSAQGLKKSWSKLRVRVVDTQGVTINGNQLAWRKPADPMDQGPPAITGDLNVTNLGWDTDGRVNVKQEKPVDMTVLAIFGTLNVGQE